MAADFAKVEFLTLDKKADACQVCGTITKVNLYSECKSLRRSVIKCNVIWELTICSVGSTSVATV